MGKHSLGDTTVFWRSFSLTVLRWLIIVAVPLLVAFGIFKFVVKPGDGRAPARDALPTASPSGPGESPSSGPSPAGLPNVQVLKGSAEAAFVQAANTRLSSAGYTVVTTGATSRPYDKTTIFYQPGYEQQAAAAAAVVSATVTEPAPDNLDKAIPLTVVTGSDYKA